MAARTKKSTVSGEATWGFQDDRDTGIHSAAANQVAIMAGGSTIETYTTSGSTYTGDKAITGNLTVTGQVYNASGNFRVPQAWTLSSVVSSIADATTQGGFFAISNPFGANVLIQNVIFNLGTAASSATATVDIGTTTASNSSSDNLMDGLVITTAGVFQNDVDFQGTNGKTSQKWTSNTFVTGTVATGNVSAAVASVYITAIRV
jgi:hypothetical protein